MAAISARAVPASKAIRMLSIRLAGRTRFAIGRPAWEVDPPRGGTDQTISGNAEADRENPYRRNSSAWDLSTPGAHRSQGLFSLDGPIQAAERRAVCWKNSAWLITAETWAGWKGLAMRKAGSGRSPVRKRSG